ncbi:hypothetical protein LEP1GSC086_0941 [Leptospira weilii str. LNT 1234]|nr:hypothetical protein LEP1GSC086_0941 [Leptospira weilii str. LNT 1234]
MFVFPLEIKLRISVIFTGSTASKTLSFSLYLKIIPTCVYRDLVAILMALPCSEKVS